MLRAYNWDNMLDNLGKNTYSSEVPMYEHFYMKN